MLDRVKPLANFADTYIFAAALLCGKAPPFRLSVVVSPGYAWNCEAQPRIFNNFSTENPRFSAEQTAKPYMQTFADSPVCQFADDIRETMRWKRGSKRIGSKMGSTFITNTRTALSSTAFSRSSNAAS